MAEDIKRDAALKALCQVSAPTPSESYIIEKCIEKINRLPMMEVVRCKDCKQWGGVAFGNVCRRWSAPLAGMKNCTRPDDFCSYGERREGE